MREPDDILVLILDDDATWLRSLGRLLRLRQADCITFTRPRRIMETMADRVPDVMVIDFVLGGGSSGADVARNLRSYLRTSCPPLVLVSSTLPDVGGDDRAVFDAAFEKSTPIDALVEEILSRAATYRAAGSGPMLRAAAAPSEGMPRRKRCTPH